LQRTPRAPAHTSRGAASRLRRLRPLPLSCARSFSTAVLLWFIYIGAYIGTSFETIYEVFDATTAETAAASYASAIAADGQQRMYFLICYHLLGCLWCGRREERETERARGRAREGASKKAANERERARAA
jgi:hypothetical protein